MQGVVASIYLCQQWGSSQKVSEIKQNTAGLETTTSRTAKRTPPNYVNKLFKFFQTRASWFVLPPHLFGREVGRSLWSAGYTTSSSMLVCLVCAWVPLCCLGSSILLLQLNGGFCLFEHSCTLYQCNMRLDIKSAWSCMCTCLSSLWVFPPRLWWFSPRVSQVSSDFPGLRLTCYTIVRRVRSSYPFHQLLCWLTSLFLYPYLI